MVLLKMKETADGSSTVNNAAVTIPAYFNDSQKQARKDLRNECSPNHHNEPKAAAIAFGFDKNVSGEGTSEWVTAP